MATCAVLPSLGDDDFVWSLVVGPQKQLSPDDFIWDIITAPPPRKAEVIPFKPPAPQFSPEELHQRRLKLFEDHVSKAVQQARLLIMHFFRSGANAYRDDLISAAQEGLWVACLRYDCTKNDTFWNYARYRVKGSVYDKLREERIIVKSGKADHTALMFISGDEIPPWEDGDTLFQTIPSPEQPSESYSYLEGDMFVKSVFEEAHLSFRENRLIELQMAGCTMAEMAVSCSVHPTTVVTELKSARGKLEAAYNYAVSGSYA